MENKNTNCVDYNTYLHSVHKSGRIWNYALVILLLAAPLAVCLIFNAGIDWKGFLKGLLSTAPIYCTVGVIEVFTYIPMLGAGASYVSFVTGNISNLKLPVALNALEQANVSAKSEEGEIVSTIAICVSSIVTTFIIIIGVILIVPLQPILESEILTPAFNMLVPALFGGLGVAFISKNVKMATIPLIVMILLFIFIPGLNASTVGIMAPIGVLLTIIISRIQYKRNKL